jgi:hypothetical protein
MRSSVFYILALGATGMQVQAAIDHVSNQKLLADFMNQLKLLVNPESSIAVQTVSALRLLKLYDDLKQEYYRNIGLSALNRHGLTIEILNLKANSGRAYHRIQEIINRFRQKPKYLEHPSGPDIRLARKALELYNKELTSEHKEHINRMLHEYNIPLEKIRHSATVPSRHKK